MDKTNIVLIGMPNSGKSTIGKLLAQKLAMEFIDTDTVIQNREGMALRDIVEKFGLERFHKIQEECITGIDVNQHVIATGGSVVCSPEAMRHLEQKGIVIFLEQDADTLEQRLAPERRLARKNGQSFRDIFNERQPLYRRYAHITIDCRDKHPGEAVEEIEKLIRKGKG